MSDQLWRELDAWVKEYAGPLSSSAENDVCDIVGRMLATERERCARIADPPTNEKPRTPEGESAWHCRLAIASAIRARGDKT